MNKYFINICFNIILCTHIITYNTIYTFIFILLIILGTYYAAVYLFYCLHFIFNDGRGGGGFSLWNIFNSNLTDFLQGLLNSSDDHDEE